MDNLKVKFMMFVLADTLATKTKDPGEILHLLFTCRCCSVTKSRLTLCSPMDCSPPGSSVLHYLPKFAQILVC